MLLITELFALHCGTSIETYPLFLAFLTEIIIANHYPTTYWCKITDSHPSKKIDTFLNESKTSRFMSHVHGAMTYRNALTTGLESMSWLLYIQASSSTSSLLCSLVTNKPW